MCAAVCVFVCLCVCVLVCVGVCVCVVIPILAHVFTIHGVPRRPRRVPGYGGGGVGLGVEGHGELQIRTGSTMTRGSY